MQFKTGWSTSNNTAHVCESMRVGATKPKKPKRPKLTHSNDRIRSMAARALSSGSPAAFRMLVTSYPKLWNNPDALPVVIPHEKDLPPATVVEPEFTPEQRDLARRQREWQIRATYRYEKKREADDLFRRRKMKQWRELITDHPTIFDEMPPNPES